MLDFQSYDDLSEEGEKYEYSLVTWLDDHGRSASKPWPEHVIESKECRLEWVRKIIELCRRAAEKQRAAE